MSRTDCKQIATPNAEALVADLFALGGVGYVALGCGSDVLMHHAPGVQTTTTDETNFYEELLVNPTLLKLAHQRAGLDCGGLSYVAVGYGDFTQLILLMRDGHVSLGVSRGAPVRELAGRVHEVLGRHQRKFENPQSQLLASPARA